MASAVAAKVANGEEAAGGIGPSLALPPGGPQASTSRQSAGPAREGLRGALTGEIGPCRLRPVLPWQKKPTDPEIIKRIPPWQVLTEKFPVLHFWAHAGVSGSLAVGLPGLGRGRVAIHAEMGGGPIPAARIRDARYPLRDALVQARDDLGGSAVHASRGGRGP